MSAQLRIEHRHLDRRFRHRVAVHRTKQARHVRGGEVAVEQAWNQMVNQHVLRSVDVFRRVGRYLAGHALAPTFTLIADRLEQQDVALGLDAE